MICHHGNYSTSNNENRYAAATNYTRSVVLKYIEANCFHTFLEFPYYEKHVSIIRPEGHNHLLTLYRTSVTVSKLVFGFYENC